MRIVVCSDRSMHSEQDLQVCLELGKKKLFRKLRRVGCLLTFSREPSAPPKLTFYTIGLLGKSFCNVGGI